MRRPSFRSVLIGSIPFVAICFSVELWDRVDPFVFGLPFNIFWMILWILLTPVVMFFAYKSEAAKIGSGAGRKKGA